MQLRRNFLRSLGITIAHGVRILLSLAVSATFNQLFWKSLRTRSHAIEQIDALVKCGRSPFHPSALRAVTISPRLYLISFIAPAMALIVIITPGSLTISPKLSLRPCVVPTVPDTTDVEFNPGSSAIAGITTVLITNTYLKPVPSKRM